MYTFMGEDCVWVRKGPMRVAGWGVGYLLSHRGVYVHLALLQYGQSHYEHMVSYCRCHIVQGKPHETQGVHGHRSLLGH